MCLNSVLIIDMIHIFTLKIQKTNFEAACPQELTLKLFVSSYRSLLIQIFNYQGLSSDVLTYFPIEPN